MAKTATYQKMITASNHGCRDPINKLPILTKHTKITVWGDGRVTYPSRISSMQGRSGTGQACCQWGEWTSLPSTSWPKIDLQILLTMLHSQVPVCWFTRPHRVPLCRRLAGQFALCVETTGASWQWLKFVFLLNATGHTQMRSQFLF